MNVFEGLWLTVWEVSNPVQQSPPPTCHRDKLQSYQILVLSYKGSIRYVMNTNRYQLTDCYNEKKHFEGLIMPFFVFDVFWMVYLLFMCGVDGNISKGI